MFNLTDLQAHARMKKPVAKHYSLPNVLGVEPLVDRTLSELCQHLEERFVKKNEDCDLGAYLSYCECRWHLTFSAADADCCRCMGHDRCCYVLSARSSDTWSRVATLTGHSPLQTSLLTSKHHDSIHAGQKLTLPSFAAVDQLPFLDA